MCGCVHARVAIGRCGGVHIDQPKAKKVDYEIELIHSFLVRPFVRDFLTLDVWHIYGWEPELDIHMFILFDEA